MKISKLLATAAVASLLPLFASAATFTGNISSGDSVDLLAGPYDFNAAFVDSDGAGSLTFTFNNNTASNLLLTIADITILQSNFQYFSDGVDYSFGSLMGSAAAKVGKFDSMAQIVAAGASVVLTFNYTDVIGTATTGPDIDFLVNTQVVPVPAAGFLLVGGLGAMAALRRRKKA